MLNIHNKTTNNNFKQNSTPAKIKNPTTNPLRPFANPPHSNLSDKELYAICKKWGTQALQARWKFTGLLPEVNKRRLYEKKGYDSIFEFAAKLAGISVEQVRVVLNLERKFEDKPHLYQLLINGEVSANKLIRIASISTVENDKELTKKVKILSQAALEAFVRDMRVSGNENENLAEDGLFGSGFNNEDVKNKTGNQNPNNSNKTINTPKSMRAHLSATDINQDVKLMQKLSPKLKQKLLNMDQKGLNINEILIELLQKRDQEIAAEKENLAQEELAKTTTPTPIRENKTNCHNKNKNPTRYIRVRIKKILQKEHGTKCSEPFCNKPAQQIHHALPFAIHHSHNPNHLKPLCKAHHELKHHSNSQVQKFRQLALTH